LVLAEVPHRNSLKLGIVTRERTNPAIVYEVVKVAFEQRIKIFNYEVPRSTFYCTFAMNIGEMEALILKQLKNSFIHIAFCPQCMSSMVQDPDYASLRC
jgi:hypothetical protein